MKTYVLHEIDKEDGEQYIVGVFSSPDNAMKKIKTYYGKHKEISSVRFNEDGVMFVKEIFLKGALNQDCYLTLTLLEFDLDDV